MQATMMTMPLSIPSILRHAATHHGDTEIVSRTSDRVIHRYDYAAAWRRVQQLAHALVALGLKDGDRIGTLAWNDHRHFEIYYAVAGAGMVSHTINPRLFPEQIAYIVNHAADRVLFIDPTFVPLIEGLAGQLGEVGNIVVMTDRAHMPSATKLTGLVCFEELIAGRPEMFDWPALDENTAASMCYTSGTTGEPKGVLYSHRSTVLHAMAVCAPDVFGLGATSVILPIVPMFHVNAWGLPYAAPMVGAKLVLCGAKLDGASLHELMEAEGVTFSAGVPTVWMTLLDWAAKNGKRFEALQRVVIGGSALPAVIREKLAEHGVEARHAWGMTETSPLGCLNTPKPRHRGLDAAGRSALADKQGRPVFGVEFSVVDAEGHEIAHDGVAFGSLLVRGPWITAAYHGGAAMREPARAGWFDTGDVVTMDRDGFIQIVDRSKDVIKSGGEWISSIELENIAVAHPAVREAAVVARLDKRWGERPLLIAVLEPGAAFDRDAMVAHYTGKVAKWCIPDDVVIAPELPHTATGKLLKARIRELYAS
ncbi:MAG TPA: long-chain-fatty-acid--CoA ligase [Candidatus Sulfotelmatobacter sp.]|nr:long-chain-fatty-acid--CoA ligase [Candidatus Sulfotelmatobacter sp.]